MADDLIANVDKLYKKIEEYQKNMETINNILSVASSKKGLILIIRSIERFAKEEVASTSEYKPTYIDMAIVFHRIYENFNEKAALNKNNPKAHKAYGMLRDISLSMFYKNLGSMTW